MKRLLDYLKNPLHKNSLFLMGANGVVSLVGFVFWIVIARYYDAGDVGLATAVVSIIPFLAALATVGFDVALVRFLPGTNDKSAMLNSCLTVTALLSVFAAIIYLLGLDLWSPKLLFLRENWGYAVLFVLFTAGVAVSGLQGQTFIAFRATQFNLFQSILNVSRLILIVPFVALGTFGIIDAWGIAGWLITIGGFAFLLKILPGYRPFPVIRKDILGKLARFSVGNYIARLLSMMSMNWMPLIIIAVLSEQSAAYFYIPFSLAGILGMIPENVTLPLLSEISNEPSQLRRQVIRAVKFIALLMVPAAIILLVFGRYLLSLYGAGYVANSLHLLWLFAFGWLFVSITAIYNTLLRFQMKIKRLICIAGFGNLGFLILSYLFMKWWGINGIGIAWVSARGILALILGIHLLKMAGFSLKDLLKLVRV